MQSSASLGTLERPTFPHHRKATNPNVNLIINTKNYYK